MRVYKTTRTYTTTGFDEGERVSERCLLYVGLILRFTHARTMENDLRAHTRISRSVTDPRRNSWISADTQ